MLARRIGHGCSEAAEQAGQRRGVHDASEALADHERVGGVAAVDDPGEVDVKGPLPVAEVDVLDRHRDADAGVVEQVVQTPMAVVGRDDQVRNSLGVGDIELHLRGPGADVAGGCGRRATVDVGATT